MHVMSSYAIYTLITHHQYQKILFFKRKKRGLIFLKPMFSRMMDCVQIARTWRLLVLFFLRLFFQSNIFNMEFNKLRSLPNQSHPFRFLCTHHSLDVSMWQCGSVFLVLGRWKLCLQHYLPTNVYPTPCNSHNYALSYPLLSKENNNSFFIKKEKKDLFSVKTIRPKLNKKNMKIYIAPISEDRKRSSYFP